MAGDGPYWRPSIRRLLAVRHVPDGRSHGVASDAQRNPVADRPAADAACASMMEAVVRCDGRQCRVRLGGRTVTSSDSTRRLPVASEGQQNTPAAHSSGRSRVQLTHTWSHVLSWCRYQGKHLGNSNSRQSIWQIPAKSTMTLRRPDED
jgi:hypothetical protein